MQNKKDGLHFLAPISFFIAFEILFNWRSINIKSLGLALFIASIDCFRVLFLVLTGQTKWAYEWISFSNQWISGRLGAIRKLAGLSSHLLNGMKIDRIISVLALGRHGTIGSFILIFCSEAVSLRICQQVCAASRSTRKSWWWRRFFDPRKIAWWWRCRCAAESGTLHRFHARSLPALQVLCATHEGAFGQ